MAAYRGVFRTWTNICKGAFFAKLLNGFKLLPILAKKAPSQMFDWVGNGLLAKGLKYWAHSSSQPLNYAEKILSQKILMTFFWKDRGATVNRRSVYSEAAALQRVLLKRRYENFCLIRRKISVLEPLFLCFLVNFAKLAR